MLNLPYDRVKMHFVTRLSLGKARLLMFLGAVSIGGVLALPSDALPHSYKLDDIAVGHIWAPSPEVGAEGLAVYGPILNQGRAEARLVGATTPIAGKVRFRKVAEGGTVWPDAIELRPGKPIALAAWREHLWLSDLRKPLAEGDSFDLTLNFGDAGSLQVKVVVEDANAH